jgi:hypothetical protein
VFVYLQLGKTKNAVIANKLRALEKVGHPVIHIQLRDAYDLGAEFFRWEFAIAVAGALMGIDAFDQPNVEEAKVNARRALQSTVNSQQSTVQAIWENKQFAVYSTRKIAAKNLREALRVFFAETRGGDYLAIMAYAQNTPANRAALKAMRVAARDAMNIAATVGYGPRFLHSTGQLHKGGANNIIALQITADNPVDAEIPGEAYSFGALIRAQALGDWQALEARGRRALRVHLKRGATMREAAAQIQIALKVKRSA